MATADLSDSELLSKLRAALSGDVETPLDGHLTAQQWAAKWGMSRERAGELIRKGVALGLMERKDYRVAIASGARPVPHYFELKPEKGDSRR